MFCLVIGIVILSFAGEAHSTLYWWVRQGIRCRPCIIGSDQNRQLPSTLKDSEEKNKRNLSFNIHNGLSVFLPYSHFLGMLGIVNLVVFMRFIKFLSQSTTTSCSIWFDKSFLSNRPSVGLNILSPGPATRLWIRNFLFKTCLKWIFVSRHILAPVFCSTSNPSVWMGPNICKVKLKVVHQQGQQKTRRFGERENFSADKHIKDFLIQMEPKFVYLSQNKTTQTQPHKRFLDQTCIYLFEPKQNNTKTNTWEISWFTITTAKVCLFESKQLVWRYSTRGCKIGDVNCICLNCKMYLSK